MALSKREEKEIQILNSAEKLFASKGYENTKMEDIAEALNISKGLVYFYYNSKENLYMAITYKGMQKMNDLFYSIHYDTQSDSGYDATTKLIEAYVDFLGENPFYLELFLNYTRLVRSSNQKTNQLTEAMKSSIYFRKIKDIHNIPITIFQEEILRGQKDHSIDNQVSPNLLYMTIWSIILGFSQLRSAASQNNRMTMYKIDITEWKKYTLKIVKNTLLSKIDKD
ncbi:TetR/AcrR family transcriptional regulator [Membranihabitans maritimus]|uniref:TetR/AcrR family transcriptional regulator n=1 Tax=Membranihabitans maritimus TaxID=2904244 RepID=UPI001F185E80|nr:TetR/AcrR family transcriptional regulator [Membranihabitans maritimus]